MTTPRERIEQLRAMLSTDDLLQMRDDPEGFAADPDLDISEGPVPQPLLRMGATPGDAPDGGMVRLTEVMQRFEDEAELSLDDAMIAEAIILPLKRPAVLVKNDSFEVKHRDWLHLNDAGTPAQGHILSAIPSVGRVNVPSDWSVPYAGTAFVVGENLLMTNRHVAEVFANGLGEGNVTLKPGASVNVNFKAEHGSFQRRRVRVEGVRMIHPYWDMAILEVEKLPDGVEILSLSQAAPPTLFGREVAVLGYPAFDPRNDKEVQHELFKRIYNVKRMQPGIYTRQGVVRSFGNRVRASCHDASTLGGNSGSAVVDLQSGQVVGLHFGGLYQRANFAVPSAELARDPYVVKAGVEFAPKITRPEGNPWRRYWAETEAGESPPPQAAAKGMSFSRPDGASSLQVTTVSDAQGSELKLNVPVKLTLGFDLGAETGDSGAQADKAPAAPVTEKMVEPSHDDDYGSRMGYDREFLGLHVAMPMATNEEDLSRLEDGSSELRYHNFSLIMNARRRLAQITASTVDASEAAKEPEPGFTYTRRELNGFTSKNDREKWFLDPRIPVGDQLPDKFYNYDRKAFDKGHLVRREAVAFGNTFEEVQMANGDSFHSTNCAPQVKGFNRASLGGIWGQLEDDVLEAAETTRCVVFSGPVFADEDREFHGRDLSGDTRVQIPEKYWKVIVTREGNALRSHAYVLEQDLDDVAFEEFARAGSWTHHEVDPQALEQMLGTVTFPHLVGGSDKMSAREWKELVSDPDTTDEEIMEVSVILPGAGAFDFRLAPNPDLVHLPPGDAETESAMAVANDLARTRRAASFDLRTGFGNTDPVLVSEMDSWGQFPLLIKETIDHLNKDYRVWSVGAAGDTAQNMVLGPVEPGKTEYMLALDEMRSEVKGFVFSAAGNDIIGEDPNTGKPVLTDLIRDFNGNPLDVEGHINHTLLDDRLDFLRGVYRKVITDIRSDPDFRKLPIFIHGYDYPFPYPWVNDHRKPIYAAKDKWLGKPFSARGIHEKTLRREILKVFINRLYEMLAEFSGNSKTTRVWLVDCRGAMPNLTDWNDEIHGTSNGFRKVAARFKAALKEAKV
jgi:DNA/RNA endonuclease G (NUC1)/V8-like Glu-specific endopeptidase